jgi:dihydrodipicolinate synthase/N-acetylneuraminate lyase
MFTGRIDATRLRKSVITVPPLARRPDLALAPDANSRLIAHMRAGGISTFLYGGNANLYNVGVSEFGRLLDMLEAAADADEWMIPSIGPDYGKASDQADLLRGRGFPTAMLLPLRFPATSTGIASGVGRLAERMGRPLLLYVKDEGFITPADIAALLKQGAICAVKYAIERKAPAVDPFLDDLLERIGGPDFLISGMGERPVIDHARAFGIRAFTSGSVCIAPRLSMALLTALQDRDFAGAEPLRAAFLPLEGLRDAHSPLRVLHAAVGLAAVADMGPMLPFLSDIDDPVILARIRSAAEALRAANDQPHLRAAE